MKKESNENLIVESGFAADLEPVIEPDRYELSAAPLYHFEMVRRDFFKTLGGGLMIAFTLSKSSGQQESGGGGRGRGNARLPQEMSAWLHIDEQGGVTVYTGK